MNNSIYTQTAFSKIIYSVTAFISSIILTRYLGVAFKGEYTWYINLASITMIFLGLGIYQSIANAKRNSEEITNTYFDIFLVQAIIYSLFTLALFCIANNKLVVIGVISILDNTCQELSMLVLIENIRKRNQTIVLSSIVQLLSTSLIYIFCKPSIKLAIMNYLFIKCVYILGYVISLRIKPHLPIIDIKKIISKSRFGFFPMLSLLLITMNYRVDLLMLKAYKNISSADLSYYSTAVATAEIIWFVPDVFKEVLFSKTAKDDSIAEIKLLLKLSNIVTFCILIFFIILGKPIIGILYGKDFIPAYAPMVIILFGIPAMSWFKLINTLYNAQGRVLIGFIVLAISSILNIVSNLILIPRIGIVGAAFASFFSYTICGVLFLITFERIVGCGLSDLLFMKSNDIEKLLKRIKK